MSTILHQTKSRFIGIAVRRVLVMALLIGLGQIGLKAQESKYKVQLLDTLISENIVASYDGYDQGGNTSVANDRGQRFKWSGKSKYKTGKFGYMTKDTVEIAYTMRNRDLGQTFLYTGDRRRRFKALTLRLGYGTNVVRPAMYDKNISVQFFEVLGKAVLDENGTPKGSKALHGFPHNWYGDGIPHERDDFLKGEVYKSIGVVQGYRFPSKSDFGFAEDEKDIDPNHQKLKGRLLHFNIPKETEIMLEPQKTYAFLLLIDERGDQHGFTLANNYYGSYSDGHGIRREGNGNFPPVGANPMLHFDHPDNAAAVRSGLLPENWQQRLETSPGTNGYPDVDTWRDLFFIIEAE